MKDEGGSMEHVMVLFLAVQALLGAISSAMTSEDALWITALAADSRSQAAAAGFAEIFHGGRALRVTVPKHSGINST
jgi:hypothetical protein